MSKRQKSEKIGNLSAKSASDADQLPEKIKKAVEGLYYMSETDAEIVLFTGEKADSVNAENLIAQLQTSENKQIRALKFDEFFSRLTKIENWFGDEEKETARKFSELKELLEKNLRDLKVFKIGQIEIDIYVVGLDSQNNLTGISTKAVET